MLDNFLQAIKRGEPRDETFHQVMEALLTAGERLRTPAAVDPDLMVALQSLRRLKLEEALPAEVTKGRKRLVGKRLIGTVPIDRIDSWLDTIRSALASLLTGDGPLRALLAYSFYLISHGPGPDTAWYIRLAIQKLEDDQAQAPHEAEALARLGAVEALPASARRLDAFTAARPTRPTSNVSLTRPSRSPSTKPSPSSNGELAAKTRGAAMTRDELQRIEQAIGRPLSAAVRRFFLNYPPELRSTTRDLGPDPEGEPCVECAADNELCDTADAVIAHNRRVGWASDFPDNLLILGAGESGETYWVDLDDERGAVYRFEAGADPEDSDPLSDSLEEFAQGLIESYRKG